MKTKFTSLIALTAFVFNVNATTYYVRSNGNDANEGTSLSSPVLSVIQAINLASVSDGNIIDIDGNVNFYSSETPVMSSFNCNLEIKGSGSATTKISGMNPVSSASYGTSAQTAIYFYKLSTSTLSTLYIHDLTFDNFDVSTSTAASQTIDGTSITCKYTPIIYVSGGTLTCSEVVFSNNKGYYGGAVYCSVKDNSVLNFTDCYFYNNQTPRGTTGTFPSGGAVYALNSVTTTSSIQLNIDRCLFESNVSEYGGSALYFNCNSTTATSQSISVKNSTFTNNLLRTTASTGTLPYKGTIHVTTGKSSAINADILFLNNTIAYNTNNANDYCGLVITATSAANNVYFDNKATLINNIFYQNRYNYPTSTTSYKSLICGTFNVTKFKETRNNIIESPQSSYDVDALSYTSSGNSYDATDATLVLASTLADNGGITKTLALSTGSSAINAGYNQGALLTSYDQRNYFRDSNPDVGAYEFGGITTTNEVVSNQCRSCFTLLPNSLTINEDGLIEIFDFSGQLVLKEQVVKNTNISLAHGRYILRLINENNNSVQKIIL